MTATSQARPSARGGRATIITTAPTEAAAATAAIPVGRTTAISTPAPSAAASASRHRAAPLGAPSSSHRAAARATSGTSTSAATYHHLTGNRMRPPRDTSG